MGKAVVNPTLGKRVQSAREDAGLSQSALAKKVGLGQSGIGEIEAGRVERPRKLREIARVLGVSEDWLLGETNQKTSGGLTSRRGDELTNKILPQPNASIGERVDFSSPGETIPVYGQAMGGKDGEFVLNGNKLADVLAPPELRGIKGAYAVYVVGDSMEPRYRAGETAYVHPGLPVRKEDYVVVQVLAKGDEPPHGYIKEFVSRNAERVKLRQLNPPQEIEFPMDQIVSIHKIVLAG